MPCEVNFSRSQPPKHKTIVQRTVSGPSFPFFAHGLRLTILLCNGVKGLLDVNAGRGREQHKVTSDSLVTICERPWPWLGTHQRQGASCVTGRPPSMMTVLAKCRVLMLRGGGISDHRLAEAIYLHMNLRCLGREGERKRGD